MGHEAFEKWLVEQVEKAGGWRKAARLSGISHSTLMKAAGRMEGDVDLRTLSGISDWTKAPLLRLVAMYYGTPEPDAQLTMLLEQLTQKHPDLKKALLVAAALGEDDLSDVLEYIRFKASLAQKETSDQ